MTNHREQIEQSVAAALAMLPGLTNPNRELAGKLAYAAVQPWLATESVEAVTPPVQAPARSQQPSESVAAVAAFCQYMLARVDPDQRPSEYALEQIVNDWMASAP